MVGARTIAAYPKASWGEAGAAWQLDCRTVTQQAALAAIRDTVDHGNVPTKKALRTRRIYEAVISTAKCTGLSASTETTPSSETAMAAEPRVMRRHFNLDPAFETHKRHRGRGDSQRIRTSTELTQRVMAHFRATLWRLCASVPLVLRNAFFRFNQPFGVSGPMRTRSPPPLPRTVLMMRLR